MDIISELCRWYESHCLEEWHEDHGVKIDTLDNPGWSLKIDLEATKLEEKSFSSIQVDRSPADWLTVRRNGDTFEAFGGAMNLPEMITIFLNWAG